MRTQNNLKTSLNQNLTPSSKAQNARGGRYNNTLNIGLSQYFKFVLLYLSVVIFFLLIPKSVCADTFNADSFRKFNTASVSDNITGKTGDQYKLTVEKGTNMQSVTGTGWYNKGTVANASGTAKATYTDTGTTYTVDPNNSGHRYHAKHTFNVVPVNKTMDSAQTATINATENKSNGGGDQYYLKVTAGNNIKSVANVSGWYDKGKKVTISATPKDTTGYYYTNGTTTDDKKGYRYKKSYSFAKWSDGNTTNSRELTINSPFTLSATGNEGKTGEQYYLTVTKDSGVSTATNSQWVNKGSSVNITATAKSGYQIKDGTGDTGKINSTKTINITSEFSTVTLSIGANTGFFYSITVNGTEVRNINGWTGTVKKGDVIIAYGVKELDNWCYAYGGTIKGKSSSVKCVVPESSGTGTIFFGDGDYSCIGRYGACSSWTFKCN